MSVLHPVIVEIVMLLPQNQPPLINFGIDAVLKWYCLIDARMEVAISQGADVNECDKYGRTPCQLASFYGYDDVAAILIAAGADIHTARKDGYTPCCMGITRCTSINSTNIDLGSCSYQHRYNTIITLLASYEAWCTSPIIRFIDISTSNCQYTFYFIKSILISIAWCNSILIRCINICPCSYQCRYYFVITV